MVCVMRWLDENIPAPEEDECQDGDGGGGRGKSSSRGSGGDSRDSGSGNGGGGQKKRLQREDSPGGGDGRRDGQDNKRVRRSASNLENGKKRFACPIYQHDKRLCLGRRACSGPGYESVHRVKYESLSVYIILVIC